MKERTNAFMELWKDIPEYKGIYQVSNLGNVKSVDRIVNGKNNTKRQIAGHLILPFEHKGYFCVKLYRDNIAKHHKLHRLVLSAFKDLKNSNTLDVNHTDGNKRNNKLSNLEWCTRKENLLHAVQFGLNKQCISIKALKNGNEFVTKSIAGMYAELSRYENICCKEKTFKENVRRALNTNGRYYGYSFSKVVMN